MKLHKTVKIYPSGSVRILLSEINENNGSITMPKWEVIIIRINNPPNKGWVVSDGPLNFYKNGRVFGVFWSSRKDAIREAKRLVALRKKNGIP